MSSSNFTYILYIRTTPEKLWRALTDPKIIRKYWFGLSIESEWKTGAPWKFYYDQELMDSGKIIKIIPGKTLKRSWKNEWRPELKKEGVSHCTYEIEKMGKCMKLTVTHSMKKPHSKFIEEVAAGWPMCLSNLKSLLETGKVALDEHPGHGD